MDKQQIKRMNSSESGAQIKFLLSFYRPHAIKGILALIIMLITASIGLLFPAMIGTMLDGFIHPEQSHGLFGIAPSPGMLALWLLILIAVQSTIRFFASMTIARITETSLAELRTKAFDHIIRLPMHFFVEVFGSIPSRRQHYIACLQHNIFCGQTRSHPPFRSRYEFCPLPNR